MGTSDAGGYQYGYTNEIVGAESTVQAIDSATEASHDDLNPAYSVTNEGSGLAPGGVQAEGFPEPHLPENVAPEELDQPFTEESEPDLAGVGLGDATGQ
jgi:hypothetical protein